MKRLIAAVLSAGALTVFFSTAVFAGTNDPVIHKREIRQQNRIYCGVQTGELTPRETRCLGAEQAKIRHDEMRMKSDGSLTQRERVRLTREQNRAGRDIYRMKHNNRKFETTS